MSRPARVLGVLTAAALFTALGVIAWGLWPQGIRIWTNDQDLRTADRDVEPRPVLWAPPETFTALAGDGARVESYAPDLDAHGDVLFIVRGRPGENADILVSRRTGDAWSAPSLVAEICTDADELSPCLSSDGRRLYFSSDRPGGAGGFDLWVARRLDTDAWSAPENLGPAVNTPADETGPAVSPDDTRLVFASNRTRAGAPMTSRPDRWAATLRERRARPSYDLYVVDLDPAGEAARVEVLASPDDDGAPAFSSAGDFLYFASDRPGSAGGLDLYRARIRASSFLAPEPIAELNTSFDELDPSVDAHGFRLWFSSNRDVDDGGRYDILHSTSREVYAVRETRAAGIPWAFVVWILLGIITVWLLYLLARLWQRVETSPLSLIARCLIGSAIVHALLVILLAVWGVGGSMSQWLDDRGTQVAFTTSLSDGAIERQLRPLVTSLQTATAPPSPLTVALDIELTERPDAKALDVALPPLVAPDLPALPAEPTAAALVPLPPVNEFAIESAPEPLESPQPNAPAPARLARSVPTEATAPAPTPPVTLAADRPAPMPIESSPSERLPLPALTSEAVALPPGATAIDANPALPRDPPAPLPVSSAPPDPMASAAPTLPARVTPRRQAPMDRIVAPAPTVTALRPTRTDDTLPPAPGRERPLPLPELPALHLAPSAASTAPRPARTIDVDAPPSIDRAVVAPEVLAITPSVPTAPIPRPAAAVPPTPRRTAATSLPSALPEPIPTEDEAPSFPALPELPALAIAAPQITPVRSPSAEGAPLPLPDPSADAPALEAPAPPEPILSRLPTPAPQQIYAHREPEQRERLLRDRGGTKETEAAVARGLDWLARHRSDDGGWRGDSFDDGCGRCGDPARYDVDIAVTGLSLLAFFAADHVHTRPGPHQDTVRDALGWLLEQQSASGGLVGRESMYSHGIATIALVEAFGMTRDPDLAAPAQAAIDFIARAPNRKIGGWRDAPGQPGDTSVLGWQVMALASARRAGLDVDDDTFEVARRWLELVHVPRQPGSYRYRPGRPTTTAMTAEGMFVQQLLGRPRADAIMQASAALIVRELPDWDRDPNTYAWYYQALALSQHGGRTWSRFNDRLRDELVSNQRRRGRAEGSWDPGEDRWAELGGRVYQTAICTLTLEVYYRYLPSFVEVGPDDDAE